MKTIRAIYDELATDVPLLNGYIIDRDDVRSELVMIFPHYLTDKGIYTALANMTLRAWEEMTGEPVYIAFRNVNYSQSDQTVIVTLFFENSSEDN